MPGKCPIYALFAIICDNSRPPHRLQKKQLGQRYRGNLPLILRESHLFGVNPHEIKHRDNEGNEGDESDYLEHKLFEIKGDSPTERNPIGRTTRNPTIIKGTNSMSNPF